MDYGISMKAGLSKPFKECISLLNYMVSFMSLTKVIKASFKRASCPNKQIDKN